MTLDYGLRFLWIPPYTEAYDSISAFVPALYNSANAVQLIQPALVGGKRLGLNPLTGQTYPAPLIGAIVPGTGSLTNGVILTATNKSYPGSLKDSNGIDLAPRFGFAYDPFGKGTTAVRGGFGMFQDRTTTGYISGAAGNYPIILDPTIYFGTLSTYQSASSFVFPTSITGVDRHSPAPYTMNMSLSVQQRVYGGVIVDVGYVGSLGRHLQWSRNINPVPLGANFNPANSDPTQPKSPLPPSFLRQYKGFTDITIYQDAGTSNYNSLQVSANRRFTKGLDFTFSWTWSKAMDYNDSDTADVTTLVSPRAWNYGLASFDRTHVVKLTWVYDLPKTPWQSLVPRTVLNGWQLSGVASFVSGAPLGVGLSTTNGLDITGTPSLAARPDVIANPILPKDQRTFSRAFNTAAFALPAIGTTGNEAKTEIRGPGINDWDMSLGRNFRLRERYRFLFRIETYNTFNHTQFSSVNTNAQFNPQGVQVNGQFGQYTAARNARIMQFSLRARF